MNDLKKLPTRGFSKVDGARAAIMLVMMGVVFAAYFFALPLIQRLILPRAAGGSTGPWVVRPIIAFHFCASAAMTAMTAPFILRPIFHAKWKLQDLARGSRYDPHHGRGLKRLALIAQGSILLLIYGVSAFFYLGSWAVIDAVGIDQHLPWGHRYHSYAQVSSLERIPAAMRSEELATNGPWYSIHFSDGRSLDLSEADEGCSEEELIAISEFASAHSKRPWQVRKDAVMR